MESNNPLAKIKSKVSQVPRNEEDFINGAKHEEINLAKQRIRENQEKKEQKTFSILLDIETINRLKRYQATEARKIETQSYIVNAAINDWLNSKNFFN